MKDPVIIIGAGRSGTNALRDALCQLDGLSTWPCDEINYIWRHGNRDHPTDELLPEHANPQARRRILAEFQRMTDRSGGDVIVEKTCANALRVAFVDEVLSEPKFVHIVRDGRDATSSAMARWTSSMDIPYILRKARFVPPSDLPHYAFRYLKTRLARLGNDDRRLGWWGPKFDGMEALRSGDRSVAEVAAHQWAACVDRALDQLASVPPERVLAVRYEDLVGDPVSQLRDIVDFIGIGDTSQITAAAASIRPGSIGSFRERLTEEETQVVETIVEPVMSRVGTELEL